MQPFVVNGHDRIVFPSNFVPELDLSVMNSLAQLDAVIRRDFEVKAPSGTDVLHRIEEGAYASHYDLKRDLATYADLAAAARPARRPRPGHDLTSPACSITP